MKISLFGKQLFEIKSSRGHLLYAEAQQGAKESKYLPDFYEGMAQSEMSNWVITEVPSSPGSAVAVPVKKKQSKKRMNIQLTPKGVHEMKLLHEESFTINTDPKYVEQQISDFKDKLGLIKAEEYDMSRGVKEISSVLVRLENRKKYNDVKDFFEQFPYTVSSRIDGVIKRNDYLKIGQVAQFVADLPKEAVEVMKEYNKHTAKICDKQAVFYIVADKKDFQKSSQRRDPILLAQSPFGHFWQILGAWDKEMLLLENL